ncbi:MAG TPA: hypothetical protein VNZ05_06070, partial [Solirubrobacteraceae bacterium]|nr:hypothetical protein [Solirubrobacteraceae bacterium]
MKPRAFTSAAFALVLCVSLAACGGGHASGAGARHRGAASSDLPGMPPLLSPSNVYAADYTSNFSPVVGNDPSLIYVPNSLSNTVDVIDPNTFRVIRHFDVAERPEHVIPSYDLKTLYVASDLGNSLQPID